MMDIHIHNDAVASLASLLAFWQGFVTESLQLRAEPDGIHIEEDVGYGTGRIKAVLPAARFLRYRADPGFTLCVKIKSLSALLATLEPENVVMHVRPEKRSSLFVKCMGMKDVGGKAQMITVEHELTLLHPHPRDVYISSVRYDRVARVRMDDFKQQVTQATVAMDKDSNGVMQICMGTCLRLIVDHAAVKSTVTFELGQVPMRAYIDTDPLRDDDERRLDQGIEVGVFYRPRTPSTSGSYQASLIQYIATYEDSKYVELFQSEHGFLVVRFDAPHNVRVAVSPLAS